MNDDPLSLCFSLGYCGFVSVMVGADAAVHLRLIGCAIVCDDGVGGWEGARRPAVSTVCVGVSTACFSFRHRKIFRTGDGQASIPPFFVGRAEFKTQKSSLIKELFSVFVNNLFGLSNNDTQTFHSVSSYQGI